MMIEFLYFRPHTNSFFTVSEEVPAERLVDSGRLTRIADRDRLYRYMHYAVRHTGFHLIATRKAGVCPDYLRPTYTQCMSIIRSLRKADLK